MAFLRLPEIRPTRRRAGGSDRTPRGAVAEATRNALIDISRVSVQRTYGLLDCSPDGLDRDDARRRLAQHGANEVSHDRPAPAVLQFLAAFRNPFILILLFLSVVMFCTDVLFADPADGPDLTGVITVSVMVLVSATLRFWQEYRSSRAAEQLKAMVRTTTAVTRVRSGVPVTAEVPLADVVPGDLVQLAAGDMIPADVRFVRVKDLQVNQAMLTGESLPAEKTADPQEALAPAELLEARNLGFMGTSVVSGSGTAVVVATGERSWFGSMARTIVGARPETAFDQGIKRVTRTLITFMLIMVPVVFVINAITKDWITAFLFGVTTAVGLTPEMLPLVVTAGLAKGSAFMAKRKVIVKRLNAIQNLGAMDVLATDKTGTLTEDRIVLERHVDVNGDASERTLSFAALTSTFQTGLRNLLDAAVLRAVGDEGVERLQSTHTLVDEVPFDFERRRMSVVVDDGFGRLLVTKGAVEEVLACSAGETVDGRDTALTDARRAELEEYVAGENALGMRVLAVAVRSFDGEEDREYGAADEKDLTLVGFLSFLDPPKATAGAAIESLRGHGVAVKVITGDNPLVAAAVCTEIGIDADRLALGSDTEGLSLRELGELAEQVDVFAKVNPAQKARIVESMRENGHTVGFLGDGINDAPALRTADVGISVDTAVDIAKESADIILLAKDLTVLEGGVIEGRRTFVNTMKYISMTASSNFGNMFSVLVASALLPFIPMIPLVVLVQNLAYDLSMLTLPWDRVDEEDVAQPRAWRADALARFMVRIGPISSIFDITTFALMWFVFQANAPEHAAFFQSGWFVESIISQTLIVHMLRTARLPFVRSRASLPVLLATGAVCVFGVLLPFSGWGAVLGLVPLPWSYFPFLVLTLLAYCVVTQVAKRLFIRRYGVWI
ncbi:magnesium-translocating P-type ATPase [Microbacterium sp.]|uniref:magnesium-translocating P-type ATPase n=1 Tax=Microbacterium sp. TaxID=51671 RepID=UPI00333E95C3